MYKAHMNDVTKKVQTVKEHSENTAELCRAFSIPALQDAMYVLGLLHDIGKYQNSFQRRINGENLQVEHSICGALAAAEKYNNALGLMMAYCIAGHHSGIPDGGYQNDTADMTTLSGRKKRAVEDYSAYQAELEIPPVDERAFAEFLLQDCGKRMDILIDKFAFFTRYSFSCLVDADSIDTADFCGTRRKERLSADFRKCLSVVDEKLASFVCKTGLQKARALLQKQVFEQCQTDSEIYLMNMPTGSGKTLCSLKFALERAVRREKKRIIYIIPYNSIIEQTADVFEALLGEAADILRHQSTFSYEDNPDYSEDYRLAAKCAVENWDAPLIITTAVQFFESIYSNKRGRLRKLHNMADSILIFDEAHLMPADFLKPCLEAVSYITKYLNSEAVFLTATMPDFRKLVKDYALSNSEIMDLIHDTSMYGVFKKCRYEYLGQQEAEAIIRRARHCPSSLIIVNRRKTARELFALCSGRRFHLSTYMTAYDRKRVIAKIKEELEELEQEFPDMQQVPEERRITVVSTSLIEAGVDLDFFAVFRERSGLDSILQAGGRCNREGKRSEAGVYIFDFDNGSSGLSADERGNITKGLLSEYEDISCQESIQEYYNRLFFLRKEAIAEKAVSAGCPSIQAIPFREYSEGFELIDSGNVSVVAARDEESREIIEKLKITGFANARKLQGYSFSIYQQELDDLLRQHVVDDFGSGIWCLTNLDYYDEETGVLFEAKDYFIN